MIELPESLTLAKQLNETIQGKTIAEVDAEHTRHSFAWYVGDPKEYDEKIAGKVIGKATGIGSMVEIEVEDYRFVVGDGANVRYFPAGKKLPDRYQTRITFEDDSSMICTVQMYGAMFLFRPVEYDNFYYWVGKEKPMPGTKEFDYEYFCSLREGVSEKLSVKAFLATEQRIPGLGNGVLQDILLKAGLHPKRKLFTLEEADWKRAYDAVLSVLEEMTAAGGRDTEKDLFGCVGGYQTKLSKKNVGGYCPLCGSPIEKQAYMGGTVYVCPACQPLT